MIEQGISLNVCHAYSKQLYMQVFINTKLRPQELMYLHSNEELCFMPAFLSKDPVDEAL